MLVSRGAGSNNHATYNFTANAGTILYFHRKIPANEAIIWLPKGRCLSSSGATLNMMTSSNGTIFGVTGPLCGEFTGPVNSPHKGQWRGALMFSLICTWINNWVNNHEVGDLRRHRGHYDVNVMEYWWVVHMNLQNTSKKYWQNKGCHKYVQVWWNSL